MIAKVYGIALPFPFVLSDQDNSTLVLVVIICGITGLYLSSNPGRDSIQPGLAIPNYGEKPEFGFKGNHRRSAISSL